MNPQQEFQAWAAWVHQLDTARSTGDWTTWQRLMDEKGGGESAAKYYAGESLSQAARAYQHRVNPQTGQREVYNQNTQGWDPYRGYWSHPESLLQAGFGAGLGGVGIANAVGAIGGASQAAGATGANTVGPLAEGLTAPATEFSVPSALTEAGLGPLGSAANTVGPLAEGLTNPATPSVPASLAAVSSAPAGLISKFLQGNKDWLGPALAIGGGLAGRALAGSNGMSTTNQSMEQLLQEMLARIKAQEPLQQAINAQALGGLPRMK